MQDKYKLKEKQEMFFASFLIRLTLDFMFCIILKNQYQNIAILKLGYDRGAFIFCFDILKIVVSYLASFFFSGLIIRLFVREDEPQEMIMVGLLMVSILPNLSLFAYGGAGWKYFFIFCIFWIWFICIVYIISTKIRLNSGADGVDNTKALTPKSASLTFYIVCVLFVVGSIALAARYNHGFKINLNMDSDYVYLARTQARGAFGTVENYFRNNAMYMILPLILTIAYQKRKNMIFIFSAFVLLLLYTVDAQKAIVFIAAVSLMISIFVNEKPTKAIVFGLLSINLIICIFTFITNSTLLSEAVIKRIYFLPAIISKCQFEYVNQNNSIVVMFSSLARNLGLIKDYAYANIQLPFVIGSKYFGSVNISANTGAFAGAYVYGIFGLIVIPIIYAYLFCALKIVTNTISFKFYISVVVCLIYVIQGASITSVILVYGMLLAIVLLSLMKHAGSYTEERETLKIKFKFKL